MQTLTRPDDLYACGMAKREMRTAQEVRDHFREVVDRALEEGVHTIVGRHSRNVVAVVPMEWYRRMAALDGDPTEL